MRLFVAGFQHETNSFAPTPADWPAFERGDFFPAYSRGAAMLARVRSGGLPIAGFLAAAAGHEIVPSCWAGASPSGPVTRPSFERIVQAILDDLRAAQAGGRIDGLYLDLHGAAVCEGFASPDAHLVGEVRRLAGDATPIVVSLDLHANVDPALIAAADYVTAYRTYPHVDMVETGARAFRLLQRRLALGRREAWAVRRLPFLIPILTQNTLRAPASTIYAEVATRAEAEANFCTGFPAADVAQCGPAVWAYGADADRIAEALLARVAAAGPSWRPALLDADAAVDEALALAEGADRPIVIADVQDNPGAGSDANTTGLLHALRRRRAGRRFPRRVAIGLINDPDSAARAWQAGIGATLDLSIGRSVPTWSGAATDPPVRARGEVVALHDGPVVLEGPMLTGATIDAGKCACLDVDGILVAVSSAKTQMLDRILYRMVGIEAEAMKILVNKSAVHFHADFDPIAARVLHARAPGPMAADPADLPWRHLDPGVAVSPPPR